MSPLSKQIEFLRRNTEVLAEMSKADSQHQALYQMFRSILHTVSDAAHSDQKRSTKQVVETAIAGRTKG